MADAEAAVAIIQANSPEPSVLLIRRAEREGDPWSGHWSFPGGRCEPEDADLLHTALRELEEECGIRLPRESVRKALSPSRARRKVGRFLVVAPYLFGIDFQPETTLDPNEAVEARWIPRALLEDPTAHVLRPVPWMPREMLFPSIDLQPVPLWGFTYRLLTDWLSLIPMADRRPPNPLAGRLLDVALSNGALLRQDWTPEPAGATQQAQIEGPIPVNEVLTLLSAPWPQVPPVHMVEVRPDLLRVTGLAFEEYVIRSV